MKISQHRQRRQPGFTLVEIMIAMTILMVIMTAIYASWTAILRSSQSGLRAAAEVQRTRMTVKCVDQALSSTVFFTENAAFYSFEADTSSDFAYLSLVSRLPPDFPGSSLFPDQPMRRVTFEVVQGTGGNELRMTQASLIQVLDTTEQEGYPLTLATNVSHFTLEFWDDQLQDWSYEWLNTNQIPRMVKFSMGVGAPKNNLYGPEEMYTKTVYLAGTAITKDFQMPDAAGGTAARGGTGAGGTGKGKGKGGNGQGGQGGRGNGQGGRGGFGPGQGGRGGFGPGQGGQGPRPPGTSKVTLQ